MTTTLMPKPLWRIFVLKKHQLPLLKITLKNQFQPRKNPIPQCYPTIREHLHQNPGILLNRHRQKIIDENLLMI